MVSNYHAELRVEQNQSKVEEDFANFFAKREWMHSKKWIAPDFFVLFLGISWYYE